ncbi:hypothetical protein DP113_14550 [Brasilonema octagenarum UFV-E1]|uniref:Uncharacterized protein n=2 Tax=Brasilonema TaxID=383614 RepID=A0A856MJ11_9CYAN|nr:hypothetical protein [Brasilonema octagenarum UFV-OR1]QDL08966.1 hypothetical protein DP114_14620 [Brasilonema sennae CENA114]QDL15321.1 hypothetical protein DP113_14550 [Brasilonema octagenarum UFV-E1]
MLKLQNINFNIIFFTFTQRHSDLRGSGLLKIFVLNRGKWQNPPRYARRGTLREQPGVSLQ